MYSDVVVDGEVPGGLVRGGGMMLTFAEPDVHWASWGEWTSLFYVQEYGSTHEVKHIGIQPQMVVTGYGHSGEIRFEASGHEGARFASWSSTISNAPSGSGSTYTLPISSNTPPGVYTVTGHGVLGCDHVATVVVVKVDLVNAWETDDVCNRVLNPKQTTSTRLFVATEGSGQAEITVKASVQPAGVEDKVLCAVYDGSTHLVSDAFSSTFEAELNFTPTGPAKNYLLKVGIDANGNGTLESSEFCTTATNFDVTAFTSTHYDDEEDYLNDQASSWLTGWAYPVGSSLLLHFLNDPSLPLAFDTTTTVGINCFTQSNLTHNAGETFARSGAGTVEEVRWNAISDAGEKVGNSDEVQTIINAILTAHSAEVTAYFAANPTATSCFANWTSNNVPVNFAQTGYLPLAGYDLHIAFGHATIPSITVGVVVKKGLFGDLYIDSLVVTGSLTDLYDFNYEDGGLAARAAVLQIGWDPDITGRDAGNIFFDRVNFQGTFDEWDFDY